MFKPERLSAFSDGVVAIAITLLVLGMEVPSVHQVPPQELGIFLSESLHPFLGFVCSFVLIGTYWLQHYAIFHYITHVNRGFVAINGLFLLCISFIPFPTGLQASYRQDELAIVIYGCAHIACGLSLLSLWKYATGKHRLIAAEVSTQVIASMTRRITFTPLICLGAIGVSFISINASRILFLTIPILYLSHKAADAGWMQTKDDNQNSEI